MKYNAEDANIEENVLLISINKTYYSDISQEELHECTRGAWVLGERRENVNFAFAVFQGVVREVYKVSHWLPAGTLSYNFRETDEVAIDGRWEFKGKVALSIRKKYIGKSVRNYITAGSQNPIKYINCSQKTSSKVLSIILLLCNKTSQHQFKPALIPSK